MVPLKGGIGGIVHPPIGRKDTTYIPHIVLAFWGVICYLPPFRGTRNNHWQKNPHETWKPEMKTKLQILTDGDVTFEKTQLDSSSIFQDALSVSVTFTEELWLGLAGVRELNFAFFGRTGWGNQDLLPRMIHASGVRNWIQGSCELWTRWRRIVSCSADHGFTESRDFVICFYSHWKGPGDILCWCCGDLGECCMRAQWQLASLASTALDGTSRSSAWYLKLQPLWGSVFGGKKKRCTNFSPPDWRIQVYYIYIYWYIYWITGIYNI